MYNIFFELIPEFARPDVANSVIDVIKKHRDPEVKNKVVICMDPESNRRNLAILKQQLQNIGISWEQEVKVVWMTYDEMFDEDGNEIVKELMPGTVPVLQLVKELENDSDIYADVTYGHPYATSILMTALLYTEKVAANTYVKGVYCYGQNISGAFRVRQLLETIALCKAASGRMDASSVVEMAEELLGLNLDKLGAPGEPGDAD